MPDYQRGKIYKLVCNVSGDVYYGSTTQKHLSERIAGHKNNYNSYLKGGRPNVTAFQILERDNYYYSLVELVPCHSSDELHARERFYIENNPCINKQIPNRTRAEYLKDNKTKISEYKKLYNQNYNIQNKELVALYHKKHNLKNKEKVTEQQKKYREENKEIIRQKARSIESMNCGCGGHYKPDK